VDVAAAFHRQVRNDATRWHFSLLGRVRSEWELRPWSGRRWRGVLFP
jgi:hypothetical protein